MRFRNWLQTSAALTFILLAASTPMTATAETDPRFFGAYCGEHIERLTVTHSVLDIPVWSETHELHFQARAQLRHEEPSRGVGFVYGSGRFVATQVPDALTESIREGDEITFSIAAGVVARGTARGSLVAPALGGGFGWARLSSDGETLTVRGLDRHVRLSKANCENEPPTARIIAPDAGDIRWGDPVSFRGDASDPEDGSIPSDRLVWASDKDGALGTGASLDRPRLGHLSPGRHVISFTATDSGGRSARAEVVLSVTNNAPSVAILQPAADAGPYFASVPITIRGLAGDTETGALTGDALEWVVGDDVLALGESGDIVLPEGRRRIRLIATDPDGESAEASVTIDVLAKPENAPPRLRILSPRVNQLVADASAAEAIGVEQGRDQCLDLRASVSDEEGDPVTVIWQDRADFQVGVAARTLGAGAEIDNFCDFPAVGGRETWRTIMAIASDGVNPPVRDAVRILVLPGGLY